MRTHVVHENILYSGIWSMAQWCVAIPGGVVAYSAAGGEGDGALELHRLHERDGVWQFQRTPGPSLTAEEGYVRHVITCQTALDASQGVKVPFLVTCRRDSSSELEILALSGLSSSPVLTHSGVLDPALECNLNILNGPTIVWTEHSTVCVAHKTTYHSLTFTKQQILMNKFISSADSSSHEIEKIWCFDSSEDGILLFLRLSSSEGQPHWLCLSLAGKTGGHELGVKRGGEELGVKRGGHELGVKTGGHELGVKRGDEELGVTHLPSHCYVPTDYGVIATCMAVHYCWCVGREGDITCSLELLVGTRYRQVVLLRGGIPLHCISMETTPKELAVLQIPGDGAVAFAVRSGDSESGDGELTAYCVSSEGEPREVGRWVGVDHTLIGDFANLPTEQLLIIYSGSKEEIVEFTVTDIAGFTAGSQARMEDEVVTESISESVVSAVKALQVQQRVGETHLTHLQRELQQKTELLKSSLQLLTSLSTGPSTTASLPPPRDQSLVCVLPGKIEGDQTPRSISDSAHHRPVVTGCWQRLLNGHWVVGVVLRNSSESVWKWLSLALVLDDGPVVGGGDCRLVWVGSKKGGGEREEGSCKQPATKRLKTEREEKLEELLSGVGVERVVSRLQQYRVAPGDEACLVTWVTLLTALECERISSGVLSGSLVLQWLKREKRCGDVRGGKCDGVNVVEVGRMELSLESLTDPALQCGEQCLHYWDGRDSLSGQWRDFSLRDTQDLASLLATRHTTQLWVSSHFTDLHSLGDLLRERMPLPSHRILPHRPHTIPSATKNGMETGSVAPGMGTELWNGESKELSGVYLHVSVCGRQSATITALYRTHPALSVVVSALRRCVPDDVTISHPHSTHTHTPHSSHLRGEQTQHLRQCVAALRRELEKRQEMTERVKEGQEGIKVEGREGSEEGTKGEGSEEREFSDSGLIEAIEDTDFAMFTAMQSLGM